MKNKMPINMSNNQSSTVKSKALIITTLLLIGVAFWVLNVLTPEYNDDYFYKFIFDGNDANVNMPIISLGDVLISQYNHYFNMNGRAIVHVVVQLFSGMWGKPIFNVINSLAFLVFIYAITRLYTKITASNLLFSACVFLLLYPWVAGLALWMTGSINYLWSSALVCIFLLMIEKHRNDDISIKYWVWGFVFIFVGWTHEGVTCPMAISLVIYILIQYKTIYKKAIFPIMIGFIIGALLCSLAPGTLHRASANDGITISLLVQKIISGFTVCSQLKAVYLLLFSIIVLCFVKRKREGNGFVWLKGFYKTNIIVCNALLFSFGIVFMSGFITIGPAIGVELFSIILFLRILSYGCKELLRNIKIGAYISSGILYCCIVYYSVINYQECNKMTQQLESKGTDIVLTYKSQMPQWVKSYILTDYDGGFLYSNYWNNFIAATYNHDSLVFIPAQVYDDIIGHTDKIEDIQQQGDYPFYVVPITDTTDCITPTFILTPTDFSQVPFYLRPMASTMLRYTATELPASPYGIININNQNYLFVGKNTMIDDRVESISLK